MATVFMMMLPGGNLSHEQTLYSTDLKPLSARTSDGKILWHTLDNKVIKFPGIATATLSMPDSEVNKAVAAILTERMSIDDYDEFGINFRRVIFILLNSKMEIVECRILATPLELYKQHKIRDIDRIADDLLPEIIEGLTKGHWNAKAKRPSKRYYYGGFTLSIN